MPIDKDKVEKLKTLLKLTNDGLSEKSFTIAFKQVIDFIKKVRDDLYKRFSVLENDINTKVNSKISQVRDGKNGYTPIKGKDYFDGDKGDTPTNKELEELITPLIPKPITGADGSPDVPKVILKKIRSLKDGLNIDDIDGLQELLDELEEKKLGSRVSGGGLNVGSWAIRTVDNEIIGTGDGSTTDFDVNIAPSPATSLHILVGTVELFLTDDWTLSGRTVSFIVSPPKKAKIRANYRIG